MGSLSPFSPLTCSICLLLSRSDCLRLFPRSLIFLGKTFEIITHAGAEVVLTRVMYTTSTPPSPSLTLYLCISIVRTFVCVFVSTWKWNCLCLFYILPSFHLPYMYMCFSFGCMCIWFWSERLNVISLKSLFTSQRFSTSVSSVFLKAAQAVTSRKKKNCLSVYNLFVHFCWMKPS